MNLDKAIEILQLENKHPWNREYSDLRNAVSLGIEALKRVEDWRQGRVLNPDLLLPGETEE